MNEELKPCPFCSKKTMVDLDFDYVSMRHYVGCGACGCSGGRWKDKESAVLGWNARPPIAEQTASGLESNIKSFLKLIHPEKCKCGNKIVKRNLGINGIDVCEKCFHEATKHMSFGEVSSGVGGGSELSREDLISNFKQGIRFDKAVNAYSDATIIFTKRETLDEEELDIRLNHLIDLMLKSIPSPLEPIEIDEEELLAIFTGSLVDKIEEPTPTGIWIRYIYSLAPESFRNAVLNMLVKFGTPKDCGGKKVTEEELADVVMSSSLSQLCIFEAYHQDVKEMIKAIMDRLESK